MKARSVWTYDDYAALPENGKRYEIHDGELRELTAPSPVHQIVSGNLNEVLRAHVKGHRLGLLLYAPLDVVLNPGPRATVLQPDLLYIDPVAREALKMAGMFGPPTLAVEILSPSTRAIDRGRKRGLYARYGVPYLWFVDPRARDIEALALDGNDYVQIARVSGDQPVDLPPFSGLGLVPAALWADLPLE